MRFTHLRLLVGLKWRNVEFVRVGQELEKTRFPAGNNGQLP
jgi:hypothetical protein